MAAEVGLAHAETLAKRTSAVLAGWSEVAGQELQEGRSLEGSVRVQLADGLAEQDTAMYR